MLGRNLFDEAARVLAMPVPRRKAINYVAAGFAGAGRCCLSFGRSGRGRSGARCVGIAPAEVVITDPVCYGKSSYASCTVGGKAGRCAPICHTCGVWCRACCRCVV
jgi:hypothetical protein